MDEEELLRRALGEPSDDPEARERARARLQDAFETTTLRAPGRSRKIPVLVGLAVAAVVLALVAVIVPATRESAAARELRRLSEAASLQPTLVPEPGQVLVWTAETLRLEGFTDVATDSTYDLLIRSSVERRADARGAVVREETIRSVGFASDEDRAVWEAAGSPELPEVGDVLVERFPPEDASWFDPEAVSTDPEVLIEALRNGEVAPLSPGDDHVFLVIGELLREPSLTLEQREALFEVAAGLDGVEVLGDVEDQLGRSGRGFALETEGRRAVIIFDPVGALPLATELYDLTSGTPTFLEWTAFDGAELV